jgi:ribosomal protein S18 acetylase RimI-like enzyme
MAAHCVSKGFPFFVACRKRQPYNRLLLNDLMIGQVMEIAHGSREYERECVLRNELLRAPLGLSLYDEDLTAESAYRHFGIFCSTSSECLASLVAIPEGDGLFKVKQMAVREDQQKQGLGTRLLSEAEARLAKLGARQIYLHARESAIGFYSKSGYEVVGQRFEEVTIPHFKMEKCLNG